MSAIPELQDELDQKVMTTIEWLFSSVLLGNMTGPQFSTGCDAVFMAVAGLVDKDFINLMTKADIEVGRHPGVVRRFFIKADTVVSFTWAAGAESIEVVAFKNGDEIKREDKTYGSAKEARDMLQAAGLRLVAAGYREL